MKVETQNIPDVKEIVEAGTALKDVVLKTPLMKNINLSEAFGAEILLKREDLQVRWASISSGIISAAVSDEPSVSCWPRSWWSIWGT